MAHINPVHDAAARESRPPRGRPALDRLAQRRKILAAAGPLFIDHGFAATTLEAIGRAAGVTKRTIYQHVGNKAQLFHAVCHERPPLPGRLRAEIAFEGTDLRGLLLEIGAELIAHAFSKEAIAVDRLLMIESMRFPSLVREVIESGMGKLNRDIAGVFDELIDRRLLAPVDTARAAHIFYDAVIGNRMFRIAMGHDEAPPGEEELAQRVDMVIDGLLRRRPA